ncbi:PAS domain S-box protein [Fibrella sp. USSR17]
MALGRASNEKKGSANPNEADVNHDSATGRNEILAGEAWMESELQRLILNNARDHAVFTTDLSRRVRSWNFGASSMFGYTETDIVGQLGDLLFTEEDRQDGAPQQEANRAIREGYAENERWHRCKDGSRVYGSGTTTPLRSEAGLTIGLVKIMRNLTRQKLAEEAQHASEERWRLAIDAAGLGTWDWELETNNVYWNDRHFWLFGMQPRPNPVSPADFFNHVHPDDRLSVEEQFAKAIRERIVFNAEFRAVPDKSSTRWMSGYGRIMNERNGVTTHMSGVMFDITERKASELALQEANRRKDEFLALLAHELRNPLATLHNLLLLLQLPESYDPEQRIAIPGSIGIMDREVKHLVRLVDDLLDVSRISRGKINLIRERIDLVTVVRLVIESDRVQIDKAGLRLSVSLPDEPIFLNGDPTRLKQIVSNLLSNATKFTPSGGAISVALQRSGGEAVLHVADTGIGIPPDELSRIFGLFVQVDTSLGRLQQGLGLGLPLVDELVGLHGGRIVAQSKGAGMGSEFVVHLPVEQNELPLSIETIPNNQAQLPSKRRILVVDDNKDAATTLAMLLKLTGNETHTRFDGLAGVEAAEALRPQVVLLDINMPVMDGYQACRLIKEKPWAKDTLLIALSGYGQDEDKRRSKEAGFAEHLVKPVDLAQLTTLLATTA